MERASRWMEDGRGDGTASNGDNSHHISRVMSVRIVALIEQEIECLSGLDEGLMAMEEC